jgi:hypothetical protein
MFGIDDALIGIIGGSLLGGIGSALGGGSDDQEVTQTTRNVPGYAERGIQDLWTTMMDRLYPAKPALSGGQKGTILQQWENAKAFGLDMRDYPELLAFLQKTGLNGYTDDLTFKAALEADTSLTGAETPGETKKSFEELLAEDTATRKAATDTFLGKSAEAAKPYTDLLNQYVRQGNAGEGLFKPVSFGFGGQPMTSFVPRSNRALADQLTGFAQRSAATNTGLAEDVLNAAKEYTPNKAAVDYTTLLMNLVPNLVMGQGGTTTKSISGGDNTLSDAIMGALAGAGAGSKIAGALNPSIDPRAIWV